VLFRIAPVACPRSLDEPVRFHAWVWNQSEHEVRIPAHLRSFVFPRAFDLLNNVEPIYTLSIAIPTEEVESVTIGPGAFHRFELEHEASKGGYYDYWFVLSVPESEANPNLWSGNVASNREFIAPSFKADDSK
jgi:hypothetical protein